MSYFPYGEERTSTADGREKFGTYTRDGIGQDYAGQRYLNANLGAFWIPDPGGIKTADSTDPNSWNRYAYVGGDPLNFVDPDGRFRCNPSVCGDDTDTPILSGPAPAMPTPAPGGTFDKAQQRLSTAQDALSNRNSFSADCKTDVSNLAEALSQSAVGGRFTAGDSADVAADETISIGVGSRLPVSALFGPGAEAAGRAFQAQQDQLYGAGQTIGDLFARNPQGLTAESVLLGDIIYINPNLIGSSVAANEALLLHEALHSLGLDDTAIQAALGITVDPNNTKNISDKLFKDCVKGKDNH